MEHRSTPGKSVQVKEVGGGTSARSSTLQLRWWAEEEEEEEGSLTFLRISPRVLSRVGWGMVGDLDAVQVAHRRYVRDLWIFVNWGITYGVLPNVCFLIWIPLSLLLTIVAGEGDWRWWWSLFETRVNITPHYYNRQIDEKKKRNLLPKLYWKIWNLLFGIWKFKKKKGRRRTVRAFERNSLRWLWRILFLDRWRN